MRILFTIFGVTLVTISAASAQLKSIPVTFSMDFKVCPITADPNQASCKYIPGTPQTVSVPVFKNEKDARYTFFTFHDDLFFVTEFMGMLDDESHAVNLSLNVSLYRSAQLVGNPRSVSSVTFKDWSSSVGWTSHLTEVINDQEVLWPTINIHYPEVKP